MKLVSFEKRKFSHTNAALGLNVYSTIKEKTELVRWVKLSKAFETGDLANDDRRAHIATYEIDNNEIETHLIASRGDEDNDDNVD